jgi:aspartate/methionine/tyrosine aminotransferase
MTPRPPGGPTTPSADIADLRTKLPEKVLTRNGYRISGDQAIVTQEASKGIFAALLATTEPVNRIPRDRTA